jgi:hypothetical protein
MMWSGFLLNATQHTQHYEEFKHKEPKGSIFVPKDGEEDTDAQERMGAGKRYV